MLALHGARLASLAPAAPGHALAQRIEADTRANAARSVVHETVATEVHDALAAAGIASVALKGPSLARSAHGDPALRRSADLDVLVAPDFLWAAARVLQQRGYAAPRDALRPTGLPSLHLALAHPEPWGPVVELHWRVHWADPEHGAGMLARAAGASLARADELAVLLLCYARDGFVGVRFAADLAGWWDAHGTGLEDCSLDVPAAAHPRLAPILATAALVAEQVAGLPAARVLGATPLRTASAAARRLADPVATGDPQQLRAQQLAVDLLLLAPGGAREFARRQADTRRRLPRRGDRMLHVPKTTARVAGALARALARPAPAGVRRSRGA